MYDTLVSKEYMYDTLVSKEYMYDTLVSKEYMYDTLVFKKCNTVYSENEYKPCVSCKIYIIIIYINISEGI